MAEQIRIPASTLEQQFKASDPAYSSWLSANAGSGKTHVLTQRVIRLMLNGSAPDRILCLTFTKAAAANMKNRVFDTLAKWTMMPDDALDSAIRHTTGTKSSPTIRMTARQLFARALDTPGGLKIQTIHGFCEALLHQFPLEANVPGHFETVKELEQAELLSRAIADVLAGKGGSDLLQHHEALIRYASDQAIALGISAIVADRENFLLWTRRGVSSAVDDLYEHFSITRGDTEESIRAAILDELPVNPDTLKRFAGATANSSAATDQAFAARVRSYLSAVTSKERLETICDLCLTKNNEVRSDRLVTKSVKEEMPELVETIQACGSYLLATKDRINTPQLLQNSEHLFELGLAVLERYQAMKRRRGIIDFDDQIERAVNLLARADIRDWIRYRLDRGIDHILVDEAQDTSPAQWQIINAICEDFHSGETASAKNRTVFVVGDEKQSIFSFQGAEPEEFDRQERHLQKKVGDAGKKFHPGKLQLSFRSTPDVLHAVDRVFEHVGNRVGLTRNGEAPVHDSVRDTHPGEVQVWPLVGKEQQAAISSWLDPVDHTGSDDPALILAKRIAGEIKTLVGKPLPGMERPLEYRDILVLVRNRDRFITALTRTMKDEGLSVAGADRLKLTEHVAVEDMLAIGRAAILPQDDLSLACTLKSLFFNLPEETLLAFAAERAENVSLFEEIAAIAANPDHTCHGEAQAVHEKFTTIMELARTTSAFEFYARLMGEFHGRRDILARLGTEAEDVIDAFLEEALIHTREGDGGLESFLSQITKANPEIKREVELDRDEVRILTVHASKGLEAPVVFLVDSCGPAWREAHRPSLLPLRSQHDYHPLVWLPSSKHHTDETREAASTLEDAAHGEYRRLLYVGMTRAADRLIICGYHGVRAPQHDHWHRMVHEALSDTAEEMCDVDDKTTGWRWISKAQPPVTSKIASAKPKGETARTSLPKWLFEPARAARPLPRPLSPSGAFALVDDGEPLDRADGAAESLQDNRFALQKGNVTHKLLEFLPELEPAKRREAAEIHVSRACPDWHQQQRDQLLDAIFGVLDDQRFSNLFEEKARAEVSLSGWVETAAGKLQISGQIDRLIVSEEQVMVLDYKTNLQIPDHAGNIQQAYLVQLALYRELVCQIYPAREIVCALMWTQAPELMIVPDGLLDEALTLFKKQ